MKKLPKEKRDHIILVCMGTVMGIALLYFGLINFQLAGLKSATAKVKEARQKSDAAETLIKRAPLLKAELQSMADKMNLIEADMSDGRLPWIYKLWKDFQGRHATLSLINVQSLPRISNVESMPTFPYQAVYYRMEIEGYYHELGKFIADFENTFPYFWVQNLELEPGRKAAEVNNEKLSLKVDLVALVKPGGNP